MKRSTVKAVTRLLAHELIVLIALITVLGCVIGYSLAAANNPKISSGIQRAVLVSGEDTD